MSDRKQDLSCTNHFGFGDEFNLQTGSTEEDSFYSGISDNEGPRVLTMMRNMFAERNSDEYELVYDVPGQSQQQPVAQSRIPTPQTQQNYLNLSQLPPTYYNPQRSNIQTVPQRYITHQQDHQIQNFVHNPRPTGPSQDLEEEEDHEEEDHEEDDSFEDNRIVHQCPECSKKYTSERRLKHHIQVHKNADAYKCPKCGYCYQSPDSLRRHWKKTPNCDETLGKQIKAEPSEPVPPNITSLPLPGPGSGPSPSQQHQPQRPSATQMSHVSHSLTPSASLPKNWFKNPKNPFQAANTLLGPFQHPSNLSSLAKSHVTANPLTTSPAISPATSIDDNIANKPSSSLPSNLSTIKPTSSMGPIPVYYAKKLQQQQTTSSASEPKTSKKLSHRPYQTPQPPRPVFVPPNLPDKPVYALTASLIAKNTEVQPSRQDPPESDKRFARKRQFPKWEPKWDTASTSELVKPKGKQSKNKQKKNAEDLLDQDEFDLDVRFSSFTATSTYYDPNGYINKVVPDDWEPDLNVFNPFEAERKEQRILKEKKVSEAQNMKKALRQKQRYQKINDTKIDFAHLSSGEERKVHLEKEQRPRNMQEERYRHVTFDYDDIPTSSGLSDDEQTTKNKPPIPKKPPQWWPVPKTQQRNAVLQFTDTEDPSSKKPTYIIRKPTEPMASAIEFPPNCKLFQCTRTINGEKQTFLLPVPNYSTESDIKKLISEHKMSDSSFKIGRILSTDESPPSRIPVDPEPEDSGPILVNPKQYERIMRRRVIRERMEIEGRLPIERQDYLHESRHLHALNRKRMSDGRFNLSNELFKSLDTTTDEMEKIEKAMRRPIYAEIRPRLSKETKSSTSIVKSKTNAPPPPSIALSAESKPIVPPNRSVQPPLRRWPKPVSLRSVPTSSSSNSAAICWRSNSNVTSLTRRPTSPIRMRTIPPMASRSSFKPLPAMPPAKEFPRTKFPLAATPSVRPPMPSASSSTYLIPSRVKPIPDCKKYPSPLTRPRVPLQTSSSTASVSRPRIETNNVIRPQFKPNPKKMGLLAVDKDEEKKPVVEETTTKIKTEEKPASII